MILAETVVVGVRQRRRAELVVGVVFLLVGGGGIGAIATGQAKKVNWYLHYPTGWLVRMATGDDLKAINELIRRTKDGMMSAAQIVLVTDAGLNKHGADPASPNIGMWADLLVLLDTAGELSAEQQDQFYSRIASVKLVVRKQIREGDPFVLQIRVNDMGSRLLAGRFKMRLDDILVDGVPTDIFLEDIYSGRTSDWSDVPLGLGGSSAWRTSRSEGSPSMTVLVPGVRVVQCRLTQAVFPLSGSSDDPDAFWTQEVRVETDLQVMAHDQPDPIRNVVDEELAVLLQSSLSVTSVTLRSYQDSSSGYLMEI